MQCGRGGLEEFCKLSRASRCGFCLLMKFHFKKVGSLVVDR